MKVIKLLSTLVILLGSSISITFLKADWYETVDDTFQIVSEKQFSGDIYTPGIWDFLEENMILDEYNNVINITTVLVNAQPLANPQFIFNSSNNTFSFSSTSVNFSNLGMSKSFVSDDYGLSIDIGDVWAIEMRLDIFNDSHVLYFDGDGFYLSLENYRKVTPERITWDQFISQIIDPFLTTEPNANLTYYDTYMYTLKINLLPLQDVLLDGLELDMAWGNDRFNLLEYTFMFETDSLNKIISYETYSVDLKTTSLVDLTLKTTSLNVTTYNYNSFGVEFGKILEPLQTYNDLIDEGHSQASEDFEIYYEQGFDDGEIIGYDKGYARGLSLLELEKTRAIDETYHRIYAVGFEGYKGLQDSGSYTYNWAYNLGHGYGRLQGIEVGRTQINSEIPLSIYENGFTDLINPDTGYPFVEEDSYSYGLGWDDGIQSDEAYDEGFKKGSNDSFLSNLGGWIVPAIIITLLLGGAITLISRKREN